MPLVNLLVAVRCAEIRGDRVRALQLLDKHADKLDDQYFLALARADLLKRLGKTDESQDILASLKDDNHRDPGLIERLIGAAIDSGDIDQAQALMSDFRKLVSEDRWLPMQVSIACAQMHALVVQGSENVNALEEYWLGLSRKVRARSVAILAYVDGLCALGAGEQAEKLLREAIAKQGGNELLLAYGQLSTDAPQQLLKHASKWSSAQASDWAIALTMGRLADASGQPEVAKQRFIDSLKLQPSKDAYVALARLLHRLGEHASAQEAFEKALACAQQGVVATVKAEPQLARE
jgi:HemY protein